MFELAFENTFTSVEKRLSKGGFIWNCCVLCFVAKVIDSCVHTFLASRLDSQRLSAASYLCHIGHHVKV